RHRHGDDERAGRYLPPVPPQMPTPVGHVVPPAVQLHHELVQSPADVGDLVTELAHAAGCAIALDYPSRSLAHRPSSFMTFPVTASGPLTRRCPPTRPT